MNDIIEKVENIRIAFHDNSQEAVRIMTPVPDYIVSIMEKDNLSFGDAINALIKKDIPFGVNNYSIISIDDLPKVHGDIDKARLFRSAWRLEMT